MKVRLDRPRPIYHIYGLNPCGGIALLSRVEVDRSDYALLPHLAGPIDEGDLEHIDGTAVLLPNWGTNTARYEVRCDNCGRLVPIDNFNQIDAEWSGPKLDPFKAAVQLAIQRRRGRVHANFA